MIIISSSKQQTIIVTFDEEKPFSKFVGTKKFIFKGNGKFTGTAKKKREKAEYVVPNNRPLKDGEKIIQMQQNCKVVKSISITAVENNKLTKKMLTELIGDTREDIAKLIYKDGEIPKTTIIIPGSQVPEMSKLRTQ